MITITGVMEIEGYTLSRGEYDIFIITEQEEEN
jgi:hypothetical protein